MRMHRLAKYTLLFVIYSLIGVAAEIIFGLIIDHRINNVAYGFLLLPLMPIYGFGAAFILFLHRYLKNPVVLFVGSVLITTALEFIAHWLFQTLLGIQFWDYSDKPFNLWGRASLDSSIGFGIAALLLVYVIHPQVTRLLKKLSKRALLVVAVIAGTLLLIETANSLIVRLIP